MALIKFEWRTWKTLDALHTFARYWRKSEELISQDADIEQLLNPPNWHPETESECGEYQAEVAAVRQFHDYDMKRSLRYTCTALLYSIIEVELKRFIDNLDGKRIKQQRKPNSGMESFLEALCRHLQSHSLDISGLTQYSSISELQSVRHCIIHCWGEMEYVEPASLKSRLLGMSNFREKGILCLQKSQIRIEKQFLEQRLSDSWDFFLELFQWAKWRIDERWLTRRSTE